MHDMDHLVNALKEHYTVAIDMTGSLFCGIHLTWNYTLGHFDCHMPRYINKALTKTNTPNQSLLNMLPTRWPQSSMAHGFRGWRLTSYNTSPQSRSNASKTSWVPSCTMNKQLTQHFLPHSVPLQYTKATAQEQWLMHVITSSTTLLHIPMQAFGTRRATWYYQYTRMRHTFSNPVRYSSNLELHARTH
jgi:hypothetical protein